MIARVFIAILSAFLALLGVNADFRLHDETTVKKMLQFAGEGVHTLDVRTMNGSIRASASESADVELEVRERFAATSEDALREAKEKTTIESHDRVATIDVVVREPDATVCGEQRTGRPPAWWDRSGYEVSVALTIRLPRAARVRLCTVNGEVDVDGVAGDFDISSVNGRLTLEQVRGSGRASTVNGRITASFAEPPKTASLFKTINGGIEATFPASLSADLQLKTFNGGLFTDFNVEPIAQALTATRDGGRVTYRSNRFTRVRVGHGGPELTFDAFNGDVRVLRAAR